VLFDMFDIANMYGLDTPTTTRCDLENDFLAWSCMSIISMAFPAKTTLYLNTKYNPNTN